MKILIDFVNLDRRDPDGIAAFCREHRLALTKHGEGTGLDSFTKTRQAPGMFYFFHSSPVAEIFGDHAVLPGDPRWAELGPLIQRSQGEYAGFLESCIAGRLDLDFINSRVVSNKPGLVTFRPGKTGWTPEPDLFGNFDSIEDFIDYYGIVAPLWRGEGERFSRVRRCKQCGKFFIPASLKREYCSDKCRNEFHYRNQH
ncbi:hypothetical protein JCM15519_02840 [Fundidesulfovibrio butyratiphilus]